MAERFLDLHTDMVAAAYLRDAPRDRVKAGLDRIGSLTEPLRIRFDRHLKANTYRLNAFRTLVLQFTPQAEIPEPEFSKHWNGGGYIRYVNVPLPLDEILSLSKDPVDAGERVIELYEEGLRAFRQEEGVPADFLRDVLAAFSEDGCVTVVEDRKRSFPKHKLMTRVVSEVSCAETRTFLCVRRMRSDTEARVHVGTIDTANARGMFQSHSFDGKRFHLPQWLRQPHWPVSFVRTDVPLEEFDI